MANELHLHQNETHLSIEFPVPQEKIFDSISSLYSLLAQIQQEQQAIAAVIKMVQEQCSHPETMAVSRCGERGERCVVCRKEW